MQILIFLPAFLITFYALYKFTKDDYVFIRRNISLEQTFDIAFTVFWSSLFFARVVYFIYNPISGKNIFFEFFTPSASELSLIGGVIGGIVGLYLIIRYKRIPIGRFFDFFTLSFMIALPIGFLGHAIFVRGYELIFSLINTGIYFLFTLIFLKLLYTKLLNRTMREGNIAIFFFLLFSLLEIVTSVIHITKGITIHLSIQTILPGLLFLGSIALLIKQERSRLRARKYK